MTLLEKILTNAKKKGINQTALFNALLRVLLVDGKLEAFRTHQSGERDMPPEKLERLRAIFVARASRPLSDFDVTEPQEEFIDKIVDAYHALYPAFSVDELLVRPREALRLCDSFRSQTGYYDLPDDMILRPLLKRRKNPNG